MLRHQDGDRRTHVPCEALERSSPAGSCLQRGECPCNALLLLKTLSALSCLQPFPSRPNHFGKLNPAAEILLSKINIDFRPPSGVFAGFIGPLFVSIDGWNEIFQDTVVAELRWRTLTRSSLQQSSDSPQHPARPWTRDTMEILRSKNKFQLLPLQPG